ncbi:MAG: S1 RNA-binding domain-containing protein, partial [Lachnospiraceae bacterium]|nr:S1 RNA-binding domain-containing protein [Lachnospiraceae bacterium]
VLVTLYLDKSERLCASMKVYDLLSTDSPYEKDSTVRGIVYEVSDNFGAFVAVDNRYSGLIPKKELFKQILPGTLIEARVDRVKPDGKLDLSLRERTYLQLEPDSEEILAKLKAAGGFLPFHDKSDAEEIKNFFKMSKAAFKRAIGHLYKDGAIVIEEGGIRLKEE